MPNSSFPENSQSTAEQVIFDYYGLIAGFKRTIPIAISALVYGLVFGILSRQVGINLIESLLMSSLVFAGSAQFIVLDLWKMPLPIETIILTTLIVNLRHLLMSASLSPWLSSQPRAAIYWSLFFMSDESWALTMNEFAKGGRNAAFLLGSGLTLFIAWLSATFIGQTVSNSLQDPSRFGLDFAFTAVFITMLVGLWKGKLDLLPWIVAGIIAVAAAHFLPGKWYILLGSLTGSFVGAVRHGD
jgi:4-azaleucine resistance transporter AzlC